MTAASQTEATALQEILSEELFHIAVNGQTVSSERAHDLLRGIFDIAQAAHASAAVATSIDEKIDSTNIRDAVDLAERLFAEHERAQGGRKLTRRECNEVLKDETTWRHSEIVAVMDSLGRE